VAGGGKFESGFLAAGIASQAGPQPGEAPSIEGALFAAALGGAGSVLGGGKFADGAITGAFAYAAGSLTSQAANDNQSATSTVPAQSNTQVAQEILIDPTPLLEDVTPEGMTPLEELPPGSANGPGAGKAFPRNLGKPGPGEDTPDCLYCGKPTTREPGPDQYNRDHIVPKRGGGNNTPDNLAPSCRTCNLQKGPRTPLEWYQSMQAWLERYYEKQLGENPFRAKFG